MSRTCEAVHGCDSTEAVKLIKLPGFERRWLCTWCRVTLENEAAKLASYQFPCGRFDETHAEIERIVRRAPP